jgi:hypothetical protein
MSRTVYQYANATIPPAVQGAAVSLLGNCDPTLQGMLAGFAWVLDYQLGAAWALAAQGFGGGEIVNATYAVEPIPETARRTWRWPCLIAWRGESRFGERTLMYDDHECDINLVYALPPMSLEFIERLSHIRVAVMRCCRMFVEEHGHAAYTAGGDNWLETIGVDSLALVDAEEGDVFEQMDGQQRHVGLHMSLVMKEREMLYDTDISDRTFGDYTVALDDGVSEQLDVVEFYAGGPLPVVAITAPVASFTKSVGQTLTISGTCSYATMVEVYMRVTRGVWTLLKEVSTVGASTFSHAHTLVAADAGDVDLKAIAYGPGGETTSTEISGVVS